MKFITANSQNIASITQDKDSIAVCNDGPGLFYTYMTGKGTASGLSWSELEPVLPPEPTAEMPSVLISRTAVNVQPRVFRVVAEDFPPWPESDNIYYPNFQVCPPKYGMAVSQHPQPTTSRRTPLYSKYFGCLVWGPYNFDNISTVSYSISATSYQNIAIKTKLIATDEDPRKMTDWASISEAYLGNNAVGGQLEFVTSNLTSKATTATYAVNFSSTLGSHYLMLIMYSNAPYQSNNTVYISNLKKGTI